MLPVYIVGGGLFALWVAASMKTSRPDGHFIGNLHPYRRLMQYIMPGRNESVVYFDTYVNAEQLVDYLAKVKETDRFKADITHCLVAAGTVGLWENPKMNQFVAGKRLYNRKNVTVTFSMKRKQLAKKAKLSVVKLHMPDGETFKDLCDRINGGIKTERSGKKTKADKEFDIFNALPRPVLAGAVGLWKWLDYNNLLPPFLIEDDGMYTSMFIANLGSVGMAPGYHHLYEWGNCPLFMMAGKIEDKPMVVDGEVTVQKTLHIRWSYDERIDDGLTANFGIMSVKNALENPFEYFGCLAEDGSDARVLAADKELPDD